MTVRDHDPDLARYADDSSDPLVSSGLKALREQTASEASRRATLGALDLGPEPDARPRSGLWSFARWALVSLALTLAVLTSARWLIP